MMTTRGVLFAAGLVATGVAHATDWPQFGYDAAHSGFNPAEASLTPATVPALIRTWAVSSYPFTIDAAPVYASGIVTPGGTKNLLFAWGTNMPWDSRATDSRLMAFDANDGTLVWSRQSTGASTQHASCSPAIDPNREFVYSYGLDGYVHKYRIGDGSEVVRNTPLEVGWPVQVTLKPRDEKVAGSLSIAVSPAGTFLEVVTNGYDGDGGDYQGHLVSIDLSSGAARAFNGMCSDAPGLLDYNACTDRMGGIWGRSGATYAAQLDRVFVTTGNGHFNANAGGHSWGDSVLALPANASSANAMPSDSYTPANFADLDFYDIDLGSMSLAILPAPAGSAYPHLGVQGGKEAKWRLLNLDDLSGAGAPAHVGGELQTLSGTDEFSQPAVWVDPDDGSTWLLAADVASGLQLGVNAGVPALATRWTNYDYAVGSPAVAGGVAYYVSRAQNGTAVLVARDVTSGAALWQSAPLASGTHWQSPIVADGAVYVFDMGNLYKFGPDAVFADGFELATH